MSLPSIYAAYGLPPPPPPTAFSRSHSAARAAMPDFSALYPGDGAAQVAGVHAWLRAVFWWGDAGLVPVVSASASGAVDLLAPAAAYAQPPPPGVGGFYAQLRACGALIAGLVLLVLVIVTRRLHERSFWLVRFAQKREGTVIIPNAVSCFTLMEGVFGILSIALCFLWCKWFEDGARPTRLMLWITVPWVSLIWGAAYSCWGALLAAPERDTGGRGRWSMRSVAMRPLLANAICLCLPLGQSITVLVPAIIADIKFERALNAYLAWSARYAAATELSHDLLAQGLETYYGALDGMYYTSVCFTLWTLWAGMFLLIYTKITWGLFVDILRHARMLGSKFVRHESTSWKTRINIPRIIGGSGTGSTDSVTAGSATPKQQAAKSRQEKGLSTHGHTSTLGENSFHSAVEHLASPLPHALDQELGEGHGAGLSQGGAAARGSRRPTTQQGIQRFDDQLQVATDAIHVFSRQEVAEDRPHASFFPPVKPSKVLPSAHPLTGSSSRAQHARLFRRLVVSFGFQFSGIVLAIVAYMSIACFVAVQLYASLEANDARSAVEPALLAAMWAAVLFGSITLFAIAFRSYERAVPAGVVSAPNSNSTRPQMTEGSGFDNGSGAGHGGSLRANMPTPLGPAYLSPGGKFTRTTAKATELAADQSFVNGNEDSPVYDGQFYGLSQRPAYGNGHGYIGAGNNGAFAMRAFDSDRKLDRKASDATTTMSVALDELAYDRVAQRDVSPGANVQLGGGVSPNGLGVAAVQWPTEYAGHKLLTPEDFQARRERAPRHGSGPSSPPVALDLARFPPVSPDAPLAPATPRRTSVKYTQRRKPVAASTDAGTRAHGSISSGDEDIVQIRAPREQRDSLPSSIAGARTDALAVPREDTPIEQQLHPSRASDAAHTDSDLEQ